MTIRVIYDGVEFICDTVREAADLVWCLGKEDRERPNRTISHKLHSQWLKIQGNNYNHGADTPGQETK